MFLAIVHLVHHISHPTPIPCPTYEVHTIRQLADGTYVTSDRKI